MNHHDLTPHAQRIAAFMKQAGQAIPPGPYIPDKEVLILRARLIIEEALETIDALGVTVRTPGGEDLTEQNLTLLLNHSPSLEKIADGCADLSVVTIGTLLACGLADEPFLRMIDESNLRKFGPGSYRRDDGKWMKPPDWQPPEISAEIIRQSKESVRASFAKTPEIMPEQAADERLQDEWTIALQDNPNAPGITETSILGAFEHLVNTMDAYPQFAFDHEENDEFQEALERAKQTLNKLWAERGGIRYKMTPAFNPNTLAGRPINLPASTDARDWARAFLIAANRNPIGVLEEGGMMGWFANAIMRGYDWGFESAKKELNSQTKLLFSKILKEVEEATASFLHDEVNPPKMAEDMDLPGHDPEANEESVKEEQERWLDHEEYGLEEGGEAQRIDESPTVQVGSSPDGTPTIEPGGWEAFITQALGYPPTMKPLEVIYTNHEGKTRPRKIIPKSIGWGSNKWHPKPQWLMEGYDAEKREKRTFALAGMVRLPCPNGQVSALDSIEQALQLMVSEIN